eukprot:5086894-Amphidinium_carterae.1
MVRSDENWVALSPVQLLQLWFQASMLPMQGREGVTFPDQTGGAPSCQGNGSGNQEFPAESRKPQTSKNKKSAAAKELLLKDQRAKQPKLVAQIKVESVRRQAARSTCCSFGQDAGNSQGTRT